LNRIDLLAFFFFRFIAIHVRFQDRLSSFGFGFALIRRFDAAS